MKYNFVLFILVLSISLLKIDTINATHYRAGEISYVQISDLTIQATLTTYTKTSSISADSDSIDINWGDGFIERIGRSNIGGTNTTNDVKISYFTKKHTYPGRATYTISFSDPNRTANILNVNWPNSVEVPFFLSSTFTLLDTQFQGKNSSAILLQPPIDIACVDRTFIHNPNAYDPDGDSLSFELISPLSAKGENVPLYKFPSDVAPGLNNIISLNSQTGDFLWETPQVQGEYNIAIRINEYREGVLINSMMRDMQILVKACDNDPPIIESIDELCVIAGEEVLIDIHVSDPNIGQQVKLTATGGLFDLAVNNATLNVNPEYKEAPFDAQLRWQTTCNDIQKDYYQIVFRAVDNFYSNTGLATLKTIRIKVLGPPPSLTQTTIKEESIHIVWQEPYACELTEDNYFQGFSVWRKEGAGIITIDSCIAGISDPSFKKIKNATMLKDDNGYYYDDYDVEPNKSYCYKILAQFAKLTEVGYPYNLVESLRSNELCATISGNTPTIIQTSVKTTHLTDGSINLEWIPPSSALLDTIEYPGPYTYQLSRSPVGDNDFQLISTATMSQSSLITPSKFSYTDENINTQSNQYEYQLDFFIQNDQYFESSQIASSIWLDIEPIDGQLLLKWHSNVPWINHKYYIWKYNNASTEFDLIDSTIQTIYKDKNLTNGKSYCYKIQAIGAYNDGQRTIQNIINYSQEKCEIPIDNNPPCPPLLKVESLCDQEEVDFTIEKLANHLIWTDPIINCENKEKIATYNIYYRKEMNDEYGLVATVSADIERIYDHFPDNTLAGCYVITAVDEKLNESIYSNEICVKNCPLYELPNTFTPNGDSHNDVFVPINNYFIAKVDFKLFNRWGNLVYETSDPQINWDGNNSKNKALSPGVYYYKCLVFESIKDKKDQYSFELNGVIHLIRGKQ